MPCCRSSWSHYRRVFIVQVNKIEISTDKVYLAAGGNPHIRLFDIASGNSQPVHTYDNHTGNVTAVGLPSSLSNAAQ